MICYSLSGEGTDVGLKAGVFVSRVDSRRRGTVVPATLAGADGAWKLALLFKAFWRLLLSRQQSSWVSFVSKASAIVKDFGNTNLEEVYIVSTPLVSVKRLISVDI